MSLATLLSEVVGRCRRADVKPPLAGLPMPDLVDVPPDARRLIRQRQYCTILSMQAETKFDELSLRQAWKALQHEMALVPPGEVILARGSVVARAELVSVATCYIDRTCVTNADYLRFLREDGYREPSFWPEVILPNVLQFTDSTGVAGPKYWSNGQPPPGKADHPVVGICWYEANAYAKWAGKRLPSPAQWQRAGTWAGGLHADGGEPRYPWGHSFVPSHANIWSSGRGDTVPVQQYVSGNTSSGVCQLIGNVWEWLNAALDLGDPQAVGERCGQPLAEIRGGAFDTYFASQATCQFGSGQPLLHRAANVGFRCTVEADVLIEPPHQSPDNEASHADQY